MTKSASVNIFRTIWICNIFSAIPIPSSKCKKEDLYRAGKAPFAGKTYFCEKDKNYLGMVYFILLYYVL